MSNVYHEHRYANGLQLLVEPMSWCRSAAFTFLVPAGVSREPATAPGCANLVASLLTRGAGSRDSRQLSNDLDNLGIQRHEATETIHTSFTAATLADNLEPCLTITRDIMRSPHLHADQLELCKASTLQELMAIEDDPGQKIFIELKRHSLPEPLGRPILGSAEGVQRMTPEMIVDFHRRCFRPNGAILGVAGNVDFERIRDIIGELFDDWKPIDEPPFSVAQRHGSRQHVPAEKLQTHIGLAFDSVSYSDADFYNAHGAVGVLSGGMSSRLWTEVREKRGLCYSVGASYHPLKDRGIILVYASSSSDRANETLEVIFAELERLLLGISDDEVHRLQAGLKSSLIMQEESTSARASVLARSWYHLGRVRPFDEIAREIEAMTPESILGYLERHPPGNFNILTLGPTPLEASA
ncbi:Peptidase M16 inactive domain protein [Planctomycetes bacterium Pan216]|uniref:Peptidase M16 inactive domain protein n=1 Tax=Kolteria novifilia TaxID=2527975 RepID=A0A518BAS4_9BACT|nr:Peptidase M16 inactive domain protein [Planctomycetes bacterium Pan216]